MKKLVLVILLLISFPWVGQAKDRGNDGHDSHYRQGYGFWQNVEKRKHKQHMRINKGIEKGLLTRREVKALTREQRHVAKQIKHYRRHRYMSYANKKSVMRNMDHYSNQIAHLKHNERYVRRDHHNHRTYGYHDNNDYRNDRRLSWVSNDYSAGLYFRF